MVFENLTDEYLRSHRNKIKSEKALHVGAW